MAWMMCKLEDQIADMAESSVCHKVYLPTHHVCETYLRAQMDYDREMAKKAAMNFQYVRPFPLDELYGYSAPP